MTTSPAAFDPFAAVPVLRSARRFSAWWTALCAPFLLTAVFLAARFEGTVGSRRQFQAWTDLRRALGIRGVPAGGPEFPLTRDITSLVLIVAVGATVTVVHAQWKRMLLAVPQLVENGALVPIASKPPTRLQRVLGVKRILDTAPAGKVPLDHLLESVNRGLARVGRTIWLLVAASFVLALLLVLGQNHNGLFSVLAPAGSKNDSSAWVGTAYRSWWASINHPAGFLVYYSVSVIGIFAVLVQNVVGLFAVYTLLGLSSVSRFDVDWLNRDGAYGWLPVARAYRTVVFSLAVHGLTLSVMLVALGIRNFPWVFGVVCIWMVMLPATTVGPAFVFRRVQRDARDGRLRHLLSELASEANNNDVFVQARYRAEIQIVRKTRVSALRIRRTELPALLVLVLLPLFLTFVQVFFSIRFGGGK